MKRIRGQTATAQTYKTEYGTYENIDERACANATDRGKINMYTLYGVCNMYDDIASLFRNEIYYHLHNVMGIHTRINAAQPMNNFT